MNGNDIFQSRLYAFCIPSQFSILKSTTTSIHPCVYICIVEKPSLLNSSASLHVPFNFPERKNQTYFQQVFFTRTHSCKNKCFSAYFLQNQNHTKCGARILCICLYMPPSYIAQLSDNVFWLKKTFRRNFRISLLCEMVQLLMKKISS